MRSSITSSGAALTIIVLQCHFPFILAIHVATILNIRLEFSITSSFNLHAELA
jgi:hypothetical protein